MAEDSSHNKWTFLDSQVTHENPYFYVREDNVVTPTGNEGKYYVIVKPWAAGIVPITKNNTIVLIGQYRYTTQRFSWEIPAGGADDGEDDIQVAARRELWEETGLEAVEWKQLGVVQSFNGNCNEMGMMFLAWDLYQTEDSEAEAEGITEMKEVSWEELKEMIRKGEITDSFSLSALWQAGVYLGWI